VGPAGLACLDPCTQQQAIADLLARLLGPIRPADYGIAGAPDTLDPSLLWGSHLAAFAVNAVTTDMPGDVYQLEQYWHDGCVTWPHKYADLQAYLGAIQKARC
jgi:hypothetical protein